MAQVDRTTLKGYFNTNDKPTEAQFANLIDSILNYKDDIKLQMTIVGEPIITGTLEIITGDINFTNITSGVNNFYKRNDVGITTISLDYPFSIQATSVSFDNVAYCKFLKLSECGGIIIFPALTTATNLDISENIALTSIDLSALTTATDLQIFSNNTLTSLDLSALTTATNLEISENIALTSIDLSALTTATDLQIYSNNTLTSLDLSALTTATNLEISENIALTSIDLSALTTATDLQIRNNDTLTSIDLSALTTATDLQIRNNDTLTSIDLSALTSILNSIYLTDNALTQSNVDAILIKCASITSWVTGNLDITGSTNAAPSATGLAAKVTLEARGITVTVNS